MILIPPPPKYLESGNKVARCERTLWMKFLYGPRLQWKDQLVEEYSTYSADEYDRKPPPLAERRFCRNIDKFEFELKTTMQVIRDYQDDDSLICDRVKFYVSVGKSRYLNEIFFAKYCKKRRRSHKKL